MTSSNLSPFGERSLTLVVGLFDDAVDAERTAARLRRQPGQHTVVVHPSDRRLARKLEPEERGIWRTLLRSHAISIPIGALAGVLAALASAADGWPAAAQSPSFAMLFFGVAGAFLGGIVAGLLTLRPDHGFLIRRVRDAVAHGAYAVVVHPLDAARAGAALATLRQAGAVPLRSL